jgi:hypothetical protein
MENLNRDELILLALELDMPSLLKFCSSSKKIDDKVCKNTDFIKQYVNRYPYKVREAIIKAVDTNNLTFYEKWAQASGFVPDNNLLLLASEKGYLDFVKLFLKESSVDVNKSGALSSAVRNNRIAIVDYLLHKSKANPNILLKNENGENNLLLLMAIRKGYSEMVKLLLQDPRIDPTTGDNYPLDFALIWKQKEIVDILYKDPRVKSTTSLIRKKIGNFIG